MPLPLPPDPRKSELLHEIPCSDRHALAAAYERAAEGSWLESCSVDLPNLRLVVRLAGRRGPPSDAAMRWLARVQMLARGLAPGLAQGLASGPARGPRS